MKFYFAVLVFFFSALGVLANPAKEIVSPDKHTRVEITLAPKITYSVFYKNRQVLADCSIDMLVWGGRSLSGSKAKKFSSRSVNETIVSPVPEKRRIIPDVYNELRIDFSSPFYLIFRIYNDGVAYRIGTQMKDSARIINEVADFKFVDAGRLLHAASQPGRTDIFHTSFEENYFYAPLDSISNDHLLFNPAVFCPDNGPKLAITESDVIDYPGMFLTGNSSSKLSARFAPYPKTLAVAPGEFPQRIVTSREDFIVNTHGTRVYPWRVIMIAEQDRELPQNDLVYRLATPNKIGDASWITPMQATDEWIIGANLFNVNFKSGINTATYKYYIDFARQFGIESVMMDAGWSDNNDLFKITPGLDIEEIMRYAKSQGIKINMWTLAMTLDRQLEEALDRFNKWGVGFIMTDFIDRDDQLANQLINRITEACARHKIMIMFHGASKPAGYNRTYPHAITREGVLGSEFNIWSARVTPDHSVTLPFTRMLAGPMDYEPGLLSNGTEKTFRPIPEMVMSYGTRTNQLAMYIVYESPIQFFSGNPSQGKLEPDFMRLLGSIPTVWDTTVVLDGAIGDYIVTARRSGTDWYVGAMTDSSARKLTIPLDFLPAGNYKATICEDGVNADRYAADYVLREKQLRSRESLTFEMKAGGGFVMRIEKE